MCLTLFVVAVVCLFLFCFVFLFRFFVLFLFFGLFSWYSHRECLLVLEDRILRYVDGEKAAGEGLCNLFA